MKKLILATLCLFALAGCDAPSSDSVLQGKTEQAMQQATAELGMPVITNFQEKRMMKQIYEMRDQAIATQSYIVNEIKGCLIYLGPSVGFGLPYATQYSSPEKYSYIHATYSDGTVSSRGENEKMPQAEPNGLFMPIDAEGTWLLLKDPDGKDVKPVYIEPRVIVSPFRLTAQECRSD